MMMRMHHRMAWPREMSPIAQLPAEEIAQCIAEAGYAQLPE
jgi:hypothetical protein